MDGGTKHGRNELEEGGWRCVAVVKQGKWRVRGDWVCLFDRGQREGVNKNGVVGFVWWAGVIMIGPG